MGGEPVIEVRELRKRFGAREALRGVSFSADRGELLAVIGPNGAGKTTLLSILAGVRSADSGVVSRAPGEIGWVPQQAAVDRMLDQTGLRERRSDQVGTLSGGLQQRVNIAIGLIADPVAMLLDEPSAGLDPGQRERLWEFVL